MIFCGFEWEFGNVIVKCCLMGCDLLFIILKIDSVWGVDLIVRWNVFIDIESLIFVFYWNNYNILRYMYMNYI